MAIPQMQLTIDELKNLAESIVKTDKNLSVVMNQLVEQTKMVDQVKSSFDSSLAKIASRTLGDYKAQKKQLDAINSSSEAYRLKELSILKKISELQQEDVVANENQIREQKQFLENLQFEYKKLFDLEKKAYEEISKKNLNILKDFDSGIEDIQDSLDKALTGKNLYKKISFIGEEFKETIEGALEGGVGGMERLLKDSLSGITKAFQMKALSMAQASQQDTARIEELEARGAVSGRGESNDDIELTSLMSKRVSSEKSASGMLAMSKGMQVLSIGVMGVVTAFKMMIDAESKVKEFNKDMLDDAGGSLSFIRSGQESLAESLNTYREGFANMANTIGMKASDIKTNFSAMQESSFFNKERLKDFSGFERSFKTLSTYSKGLGLSISDTTEMAESFAHSLAIDVSTESGVGALSGVFQDIGYFASKSNLSTKAFANQLKEVNSKSSTFNKSIAQTSSIVLKLNKTLGATTAKEFLESITDFKEKTQEDLIKTIAMAGGPQAKQMQKIAESNAKTFTNQLKTTFASGKEKEALESAVNKAGLKIDFSLPTDKLIEQFKGLNLGSDEYIKFLSELQTKGAELGMENIPELIQKLEATVKATKSVGANTYEEYMAGLKESGLGATLAIQFEQLTSLVESRVGKGKTLSDIAETDPVMLNILKEQSGLEEKNFQTLITLSKQSRVDFMRAENIKNKYATASEADRKKMDEELSKMGSKIEMGADGTYELLTKNSNTQIKSAKDMVIANSEILGEQEKNKAPQVKSEQQLMQEQVDATWGMGDRLEATLGVYLEQLNSYVARILSYITAWFGSQSDEEMKTQQRVQEEKIAEKEKYERGIKEEKEKLIQLKKTGKKDEIAKSEERIAELSRLKSSSESEIELLQKGVTLVGTKKQQEIQLATTKKLVASKAFGADTAGAKLGDLKESLGVTTDEGILDLLDEMRDIYENIEEEDATEEELKRLADFEQKVKESGLQLQLDSNLGTEYAKIFDEQGRALFESIEGYIYDTNQANTDVLHKELLSSKNRQKELSSFFKEIGAKTQEEAIEILESYQSDILEQENDPFFNKLTKEQEDQKKKIEEAMKKYGIQTKFESSALTSNLTLSKGDENILQTNTPEGFLVSETMKEAFNPALFAKAQTEENRKNKQEIIANQVEASKKAEEAKKASDLNPIPSVPIPMQDFIWREKGGLQSFSPQDNVIGFKDQGKMGSAINSMMAGNTTNTNNNNARAMFNININGGNKDEVLKTITDALKRAGVVTERTSYA